MAPDKSKRRVFDSPFSEVGPQGQDLYDGTDGWDDDPDQEPIEAFIAEADAKSETETRDG